MRSRSASRAARVCVLGALVCLLAPSAGADPLAADGIQVGSIAELDLQAVREILDASDDVGAPAIRERRALTLEEAVRVSLENNLGLQVVALDVEGSEFDVRGARSKFYPVLAVEGQASETKRAHSAPTRPDEFTENQKAQVMIRQEVPTGGRVSVGVGYGREFKNEYNENLSTGLSGNLESVSELGGSALKFGSPC